MLINFFGKYKSIVVSIALFLLLDASVLIMNFYISFEISEDASGINLAGRQRMLSQRMVKSLVNINYYLNDAEKQQQALDELKSTVGLFDLTLKAFSNGTATIAGDGTDITLPRVDDAEGREAISQAEAIWVDYKYQLDSVLAVKTPEELVSVLPAALQYAESNNLELLFLMNALTGALENVASSKATLLRLIQTIGILLAIVNFFIIMFHFLKQLRESDEKLESARQETVEILDTVNEGLFLLDENLNIGSQYSKKMSSMFGLNEFSGLSFSQVLEKTVTAKDVETAQRFIRLLYRDDINSELIVDLNPLREIQVNISGDDAAYVEKYFSFNFTRVYQDNKVKDILVTVKDISKEVTLTKELEYSRQQSQKQMEVLTEILHINPQTMKIFLDNSFKSYDRVNELLKKPAKSNASLKDKLNQIAREIHSFKGEATTVGLSGFESLAHELEDSIAKLKDSRELTGDDFLPLVVEFESLIRHTELTRSLVNKLTAFSSELSFNDTATGGYREHDQWHALVKTVSERMGKKVDLVVSGFDIDLPREVAKVVNDVVIQCIRNAVVHGIEDPQTRLAEDKLERGYIDLSLKKLVDGSLELSVKDDGQGIDYEAIRSKALAMGRWSAVEVNSWDYKKLLPLIFHPGFSTAGSVTSDAGRGVGMDVIKEKVKSLQGKIKVGSRRGVNTKISVVLPQSLTENLAA